MLRLKKSVVRVLVFAMMFLFLYQNVFACEMFFKPKDVVKADANGEFTLTIIVKWEHRKCVLKDNQVNIDTVNVEIIEQTKWKKVRRGRYKSVIKGKLTAETGSIRAWRDCRKKGISEGTIQIVKGG